MISSSQTPMNDDPGDHLLASYWGKADPQAATAGRDHHTVLGHSLDVAACAFVLVEQHATLRAQLSAGSGIAVENAPSTFAAVCALHDIGKFDTRFQRKAPNIADVLRPASAGVFQGKYDHGTEGFRQIEDDDTECELARSLLGPHALAILRAVCGHHGVLPSRDEPDPSRSKLPRQLRAQDVEARRIFMGRVVAFFAAGGASLPWQTQLDGTVVQRLGGLCAVADWLGSNVEDFPYSPGPIGDIAGYWERAHACAERACGRAGLLRAATSDAGFAELFPDYSPRDVQLLTEQVPTDVPALVIVEAEMGKGKTEAALSLAAGFLANHAADGLTVALPTMATSNAMFRRVEEVVPRLFPRGEVQLALAHSRASRQPAFQRLVQRPLRARDTDAPEASVSCARWLLNRKRVLLAQVGVGTIDQALQAALVVRHQFVRMFGLSRNVVIIDEVHAYDAYMEVLLDHLLQWLGALRVPVLLLSATLPSARRAALAAAWRGVDAEGSGDVPVAARDAKYPLVTVATQSGTSALWASSRPASRSVALEYLPRVGDERAHVATVVERLIAHARRGARVAWIRNTVREAQRAFGALAAKGRDVEFVLFHARYRACDRSIIEQSVLDRFGKDAPEGGRILIATQVVEQSLDLDFDELHSDLAPIDLLFQRTGRLHRHERRRPGGLERPRLVVHGPASADAAALRFGPSRYVYDPGTLWLADRALRTRSHLDFPADIRPLVEDAYHPAARAALIRLGGAALVAAEQRRAAELAGKRAKARRCCISPTSADLDGGPALDDDDAAVQAFTRDGLSATLLPVAWDAEGGRALDADTDAPAWHLDADRADAWRLAGELLEQTLSLPARGDVEGSVGSGAAAAWQAWRRRFERFAEDGGIGRRVVPLPLARDGEQFKGWMRASGKRRRVAYTPALGLLLPSEKDEEQAR